MTLQSDKSGKVVYGLGEAVRMTLRLTNSASVPVTVSLPNGQQYDFLVRAALGAEVRQWSASKRFTQVLAEKTFAPGESIGFEETWDQRHIAGQLAPPGFYTITGIYASQPPLEAQSLAVTIGQGVAQPVGVGWLDRSAGAAGTARTCPQPGAWRLLYWGGQTATIIEAYSACTSTDFVWARRGDRWLGFIAATVRPGVNDEFDVSNGEAVFVHGAPLP